MSERNCSPSTAPSEGTSPSPAPKLSATKKDGAGAGVVGAELVRISAKLDVIIELLRRATLAPSTSGSAHSKGDDACQDKDERRPFMDRTGCPADAGESSTSDETGADLIKTMRTKARHSVQSRKPDGSSR